MDNCPEELGKVNVSEYATYCNKVTHAHEQPIFLKNWGIKESTFKRNGHILTPFTAISSWQYSDFFTNKQAIYYQVNCLNILNVQQDKDERCEIYVGKTIAVKR